MKKKLLLVLSMVAVLMCLLSLSVFAESVYVNSKGEQVNADSSDIAYEFEISDPYQTGGNCRIKYIYLHDTSVTKIVIPEIEITHSNGTVYKMAEYSYVRISTGWGDTWSVYALADKETKETSLHTQITEVEIHVPILPDGASKSGNFANWTGLEKISFYNKAYEPQSKGGSFYNCTSLEEIHFYGQNNTLSSNFFQSLTAGGKVVFHKGATGVIKGSAMQNLNGKDCTVYLNEDMVPSDETDPRLTWNKNNNGLLKFVLLVEDATGFTAEQMASYETAWQAGNNKNANNAKYSMPIQTYCTFYGEHLDFEQISSCVATCLVCKMITAPNDPVHNTVVTIHYDSFTEVGEKTTKCQNELCPLNVTPKTEVAKALFICRGYSIPEGNRDGIAVSYSVNYFAIEEYETVTGNKLTYGVFAVAKEKLGEGDVFGENGATPSKAIIAELSNSKVVSVALKIVGFTEKYYDTKLAMGVYATETTDEGTSYAYLQAAAPNAGDKYSFVSYSDVVAQPSTEEE